MGKKGRSRKRVKSIDVEDAEEEWHFRAIVGDDVFDGLQVFQIDWEDNPDTGESYPHTWEPLKNLPAGAADKYWEEKRAKAGSEAVRPSEKATNTNQKPPCRKVDTLTPISFSSSSSSASKRQKRGPSLRGSKAPEPQPNLDESFHSKDLVEEIPEKPSPVPGQPRSRIRVPEDSDDDPIKRPRKRSTKRQPITPAVIQDSQPEERVGESRRSSTPGPFHDESLAATQPETSLEDQVPVVSSSQSVNVEHETRAPLKPLATSQDPTVNPVHKPSDGHDSRQSDPIPLSGSSPRPGIAGDPPIQEALPTEPSITISAIPGVVSTTAAVDDSLAVASLHDPDKRDDIRPVGTLETSVEQPKPVKSPDLDPAFSRPDRVRIYPLFDRNRVKVAPLPMQPPPVGADQQDPPLSMRLYRDHVSQLMEACGRGLEPNSQEKPVTSCFGGFTNVSAYRDFRRMKLAVAHASRQKAEGLQRNLASGEDAKAPSTTMQRLVSPNLGSTVFTIPVPMLPFQQSLYWDRLSKTSIAGSPAIAEADKSIENMEPVKRRISIQTQIVALASGTIHPALIAGVPLPDALQQTQTATELSSIRSSSKLRFLETFLIELDTRSSRLVQVGVIVDVDPRQPMQTLRLAVKVLAQLRIAYRCPELRQDEEISPSSRRNVLVQLLSTSAERFSSLIQPTDLIFTLSSTFSTQSSVIWAMQHDPKHEQCRCPILALVVPNTIDHVFYCLEAGSREVLRKRRAEFPYRALSLPVELLKHAAVGADVAGYLDPQQANSLMSAIGSTLPEAILDSVLRWCDLDPDPKSVQLVRGASETWPLPPLPMTQTVTRYDEDVALSKSLSENQERVLASLEELMLDAQKDMQKIWDQGQYPRDLVAEARRDAIAAAATADADTAWMAAAVECCMTAQNHDMATTDTSELDEQLEEASVPVCPIDFSAGAESASTDSRQAAMPIQQSAAPALSPATMSGKKRSSTKVGKQTPRPSATRTVSNSKRRRLQNMRSKRPTSGSGVAASASSAPRADEQTKTYTVSTLSADAPSDADTAATAIPESFTPAEEPQMPYNSPYASNGENQSTVTKLSRNSEQIQEMILRHRDILQASLAAASTPADIPTAPMATSAAFTSLPPPPDTSIPAAPATKATQATTVAPVAPIAPLAPPPTILPPEPLLPHHPPPNPAPPSAVLPTGPITTPADQPISKATLNPTSKPGIQAKSRLSHKPAPKLPTKPIISFSPESTSKPRPPPAPKFMPKPRSVPASVPIPEPATEPTPDTTTPKPAIDPASIPAPRPGLHPTPIPTPKSAPSPVSDPAPPPSSTIPQKRRLESSTGPQPSSPPPPTQQQQPCQPPRIGKRARLSIWDL